MSVFMKKLKLYGSLIVLTIVGMENWTRCFIKNIVLF